jgi:hypothetical protein
MKICDKAGTCWCPDPRNCAMAKVHDCAHKEGQCHLGPGRWMRVRCVEVPAPRKARKTRKGAE